MIAAPPPDYHQEISIDQQRVGPQGAGADSQLVDARLCFAVSQMTKSFGRMLPVVEEAEDYIAPGLRKAMIKRMKIAHRGPLKPTPIDEEFL